MQQLWWGLLAAQAAFEAVLVAQQLAQGVWWRRGQLRGWQGASAIHPSPLHPALPTTMVVSPG